MPAFTRVRDKTTGHQYSVVHVKENHEVLEGERAVDANGRALPPTPKTTDAKKAPAKKSAEKPTTTGGEPATDPKEGSK